MLSDEEHLQRIEGAEAGEHRGIVAKGAIAVQFNEFVEYELEIIQCLGAFGMSGHLCDLPRIKVCKDLPAFLCDLDSQVPNLLPHLRRRIVLLLEICQAILQYVDRAFEYELVEGRHERCGA